MAAVYLNQQTVHKPGLYSGPVIQVLIFIKLQSLMAIVKQFWQTEEAGLSKVQMAELAGTGLLSVTQIILSGTAQFIILLIHLLFF